MLSRKAADGRVPGPQQGGRLRLDPVSRANRLRPPRPPAACTCDERDAAAAALRSAPSTCRARRCVVAPSRARCCSVAATPLEARSWPRAAGKSKSLLWTSSWAGCTPCGLYLAGRWGGGQRVGGGAAVRRKEAQLGGGGGGGWAVPLGLAAGDATPPALLEGVAESSCAAPTCRSQG